MKRTARRMIRISLVLTETQADSLSETACGRALSIERPDYERRLWTKISRAIGKGRQEAERARSADGG